MNTITVKRAGLGLSVLLFVISSFVFADPEKNTKSNAGEPVTADQEKTISGKAANNQESGTVIKSPSKTGSISPETFIPTEDISQDLSVSFPVDI